MPLEKGASDAPARTRPPSQPIVTWAMRSASHSKSPHVHEERKGSTRTPCLGEWEELRPPHLALATISRHCAPPVADCVDAGGDNSSAFPSIPMTGSTVSTLPVATH